MLYTLAASVAILGGVSTWIALSTGFFLIWAAFIAWGCFFHSGGDATALKSAVICNCFGVFVAWGAALIIVSIPGDRYLPSSVWAALVVAVSIIFFILAAHINLLSTIPAVVYGYAATFAYLTQNADALNTKTLLSLTSRNAILIVPFSMIIGALLGFASGKFAAFLERFVKRPDRAVSSAV